MLVYVLNSIFLGILYACNFAKKSNSGLRKLKKQILDTSLLSQINFSFLTGAWHQTKHCCWLLRTNFWSALCHGGVKSFFWLSQGLLMWISAAFTDRQEQELFSCELNLVLNQWPVINLSTKLIDFKVFDMGRVWLFQWSWYKKTF